MADKIDFEIIDIKDNGIGRFAVKIKYIDPEDKTENTQDFSFKREDQIEDRFLDKIKTFLDNQYNTNVKVTADRFLGKKFTHNFGREKWNTQSKTCMSKGIF